MSDPDSLQHFCYLTTCSLFCSSVLSSMVTVCISEEAAHSSSIAAEMPVQGVKIVPVDGKGRGMVATKEFRAGDVIVEEAPYAAVASLQEIESVCSGYFTDLTDSAGASRCGGCKCVRYSSFSQSLVCLRRCSCQSKRLSNYELGFLCVIYAVNTLVLALISTTINI
jgi:hypothetical protein